MSSRRPSNGSGIRAKANLFAALGDETRLGLIAKLGNGRRRSISELTAGTRLTRQAITKHLRVLEGARVVRPRRAGRENLFELDPEPIRDLSVYLAEVSKRWDEALDRLKAFVETE